MKLSNQIFYYCLLWEVLYSSVFIIIVLVDFVNISSEEERDASTPDIQLFAYITIYL